MRSKRFLKFKSNLLNILMFATIVFFLFNGVMKMTYADNNPDLALTVTNNGELTYQGNLFGNFIYYPGEYKKGVIKIYNNYHKKVKVVKLGIRVNNEDFSSDHVKEAFLGKMNLTIHKDKFLLDDTIYQKTLYHLYEDNESEGFIIPSDQQFIIGAGGNETLYYKVGMDESAGNELQDINAKVQFVLTFDEDLADYQSGRNNKEDASDTKPNQNLASEQLEEIKGHWAEEAIGSLLEKGVISIYPDGTIKPDRNITRAEVAVLAGRALNLEPKNNMLTSYADELPEQAKGYIAVTTEKGLFNYLLENTFKPDQSLTREELIYILMKGFYGDQSLEDMELPFTDNHQIEEWARPYIKLALEKDIITNDLNKNLGPKEHVDRAEACSIIYKLIKYKNETPNPQN